MPRFAAQLLIVLLAFSTITAPAAGEDWSVMVRQVMPGVVALRGYDKEGNLAAFATGFSVGDNRIVSCWHCVPAEIAKIYAVTHEGRRIDISHVLAASVPNDLVVLGYSGESLPELKLANEEAPLGSPLLVIGSPQGFDFSVGDGVTSSWRNNDATPNRREIQFTVAASPGNSGGPVFDRQGQVQGVVSWQFSIDKAQNLNFAVSHAHVSELLESMDSNEKVEFSDRFNGLEPEKQKGNTIVEAYYDVIASDYLYQREYYRMALLDALDNIIKEYGQDLKGSRRGAARDELEKTIDELKLRRRHASQSRTIEEPWLRITGDSVGRVGRIATTRGNVEYEIRGKSPFGTVYDDRLVLKKVLSDTDSIIFVRDVIGGGHSEDRIPVIVHGVALDRVVEGEYVQYPGLFISLGVESYEASDGRVHRYRAFAAIDDDQLHAAVERMPRQLQNSVKTEARRDYRRNEDHWPVILGD